MDDTRELTEYPRCVIARLDYLSKAYSLAMPHAKSSITKERKRYERVWPGVLLFSTKKQLK